MALGEIVLSNRMLRGLFEDDGLALELPADYRPVRPDRLMVDRIYLCQGSISSAGRKRFVERICALYPSAIVMDCLSTPHNRVGLREKDPLAMQTAGKRTLVFGELRNCVRFSEEEGNACPNYWHFSPYGFCPHGCKYCYLAGTTGVWYSPTIKIYVNLPEMIGQIARVAAKLAQPTAFYLGKLQDGLALDSLTAYSTVLVPFFARHAFARQVILTKSDCVDRLLDLDHGGHTILSWSLNPPEIVAQFEENVPAVEARLEAMRRCAKRGYPVRAVIMPIIPVPDWKALYAAFVERLLTSVPLQRLTLGGICIYKGARHLMEAKLGRANAISEHIAPHAESGDGRARYAPSLRQEIYEHLIACVRRIRPQLELALCLEDLSVWRALKLEPGLGRCNCVL